MTPVLGFELKPRRSTRDIVIAASRMRATDQRSSTAQIAAIARDEAEFAVVTRNVRRFRQLRPKSI